MNVSRQSPIKPVGHRIFYHFESLRPTRTDSKHLLFYIRLIVYSRYVNNCDQTRHTLLIKLTPLIRESFKLVETSTVHFTCCDCQHGDPRRERCVVIYVIIIILYYVLSFRAKHEYARTNINATYEI